MAEAGTKPHGKNILPKESEACNYHDISTSPLVSTQQLRTLWGLRHTGQMLGSGVNEPGRQAYSPGVDADK